VNPLRLQGNLEEKQIAHFRRALTSDNGCFVIGNQVFHLTPVEDRVSTDFLAQRECELVDNYRRALEQVKQKEQELERKYSFMVPAPTISRADVLSGIRYAHEEEYTWFWIPFVYAPKIIDEGWSGGVKDIAPEDQRGLKTKCVLQIMFTGHEIVRVILYSTNLATRFNHFHSMTVSDCLGDMDLSPYKPDGESVKKFRTYYESVLNVVNMGSLARHTCKRISVYSVQARATTCETTSGWTTGIRQATTPSSDTMGRQVQVGDRIMVRNFARAGVPSFQGTNGRVIHVGGSSVNANFFGEGGARTFTIQRDNFDIINLGEEPDSEPEGEFQVNDEVQVHDAGESSAPRDCNGLVGTITWVNNFGERIVYSVDFHEEVAGSAVWEFYASQLEAA